MDCSSMQKSKPHPPNICATVAHMTDESGLDCLQEIVVTQGVLV